MIARTRVHCLPLCHVFSVPVLGDPVKAAKLVRLFLTVKVYDPRIPEAMLLHVALVADHLLGENVIDDGRVKLAHPVHVILPGPLLADMLHPLRHEGYPVANLMGIIGITRAGEPAAVKAVICEVVNVARDDCIQAHEDHWPAHAVRQDAVPVIRCDRPQGDLRHGHGKLSYPVGVEDEFKIARQVALKAKIEFFDPAFVIHG